ncbi:hypothetical protein QTP86_012452 [Hemibagrus guttatus]|nr:hypothetical protein QTP86_012452 [Hemibagrus guttatus]
MAPHGGDLKPVRGKTTPLVRDPQVAAPDLLKSDVQEMKAFNKDMDEEPYILLYPECSEVVQEPGKAGSRVLDVQKNISEEVEKH